MKLPSITNAVLTSVAGKGFSPDYDRDATAGTSKWSGTEPVFWSEREEQFATGTQSDVVIRRSLVVDAALDVDWAVDDKVTVNRDELGVVTGIVRSIKSTRGTGLPSVTRLLLDDA